MNTFRTTILALTAIFLFTPNFSPGGETPESSWTREDYKQRLNVPETAQVTGISDWNGYDCYDLTFSGRAAKVVVPQQTAAGRPWVWRARFWGHEPQLDQAMLTHGWHLVYVDSTPLLGSPKSVALWQSFYEYVTKQLELAPKACLEGMSRGGLYTTNWAVAFPTEVAGIYIDNPVLDFRSWPGGFGNGGRSNGDWSDILNSYDLTEEKARSYDRNPVDTCPILAAAGVPVLLVCGDSDHTVPMAENAQIFYDKYRAAGAPVQLLVKPGCDHHPHSLPDPTPIADFMMKAFNGEKIESGTTTMPR